MRRSEDQAFTYKQENLSSPQDEIQAFHQRQEVDLRRFGIGPTPIVRRQPFHRHHHTPDNEGEKLILTGDSDSGEEAWRNGEGDRLGDFGVDESVEFYDEDNLPLSKLLQQQKLRNSGTSDRSLKAMAP